MDKETIKNMMSELETNRWNGRKPSHKAFIDEIGRIITFTTDTYEPTHEDFSTCCAVSLYPNGANDEHTLIYSNRYSRNSNGYGTIEDIEAIIGNFREMTDDETEKFYATLHEIGMRKWKEQQAMLHEKYANKLNKENNSMNTETKTTTTETSNVNTVSEKNNQYVTINFGNWTIVSKFTSQTGMQMMRIIDTWRL